MEIWWTRRGGGRAHLKNCPDRSELDRRAASGLLHCFGLGLGDGNLGGSINISCCWDDSLNNWDGSG